MNNEQPDEREELRRRFREYLHHPLSERFFSEEELIAIFDSAGDYYDDYLRMEVLVLGAHLYPESDALLSRRAVFYSERDLSSFRNFIDDNPALSNTMTEIMRLGTDTGDTDAKLARVEAFIDTHRLDEDEEVIQLVRVLHNTGFDKWIVDNLDRIRSKVSYLPTLLYEIAVTAEDSPVLDTIAVELLEELTDLEPYTPDYWTLLSLTYIRHDRPDDAAQAIEYALAIDPQNVEALKAKLQAFKADSDSTEIDELLRQIVKLDPADSSTAYLHLLRMRERDKIDDMIAFITSMAPEVRSTRSIIGLAVQIGHPGLERFLCEFYELGYTEPDDWKDLAEVAYASGDAAALNSVLQIYNLKAGEPLNHDFLLFKLLFRMKSYDVALNMFVNAEPSGTLRMAENLNTAFAMYVTMLLRTGNLQPAADAATAMLRILDEQPEMPGSKIEQYGLKCFLTDILHRLGLKRTTDWQKYDPLKLEES